MRARWLLILILLSAATCAAVSVIAPPVSALSVWALRAVACLLCVVAWIFHRKIMRPLHTLSLGAELLSARDFSSRLAPAGQPEIDPVVDLFNSMMAAMRSERLRKQEQDRLLDRVLEVSPLGVIMLDGFDRISLLNRTALAILGSDNPDITIGQTLDDLKGEIAAALQALARDESTELRLNDSNIFRLTRLGFMDRGFEHPFYLIERLTDEVRRAERHSYGKVIRIMSHEVNNLMAGITSTLDTLTTIFADTDPDISESLRSCSERSRETSSFIARLANAVKIPAPQPVSTDFTTLLHDLTPLLQSICSTFNVNFTASLPNRPVRLQIDPVLIEQVMVNIVKNAAESAAAVTDLPPHVTLTLTAGVRPVLTVADNGPGITPEVAKQLFTPFFTTRPGGHGIGLTVISEILTAHGIPFSLSTPTPRNTIFTIRF